MRIILKIFKHINAIHENLKMTKTEKETASDMIACGANKSKIKAKVMQMREDAPIN